MSPSDNTPSDMTPAEEARLDRLYRAQNDTDELATSPADLDAAIRASAKAAVKPADSSYTLLQQRYGWATAAVLVISTALFLAVPNSEPDNALNDEFVPMAQPADSADDAQPSLAKPSPALLVPPALPPTMPPTMPPEMPPETDAAERSRTKLAAEPVSTQRASAKFQTIGTTATATATAEYEKPEHSAAQAKRGQSQQEVTHQFNFENCDTIELGPIDRLCTLDGDYLLLPRQPSSCGVFKLDQTAENNPPTPASESDSAQFIYTLNGQTYALTCEAGSWQVQSLARGR